MRPPDLFHFPPEPGFRPAVSVDQIQGVTCRRARLKPHDLTRLALEMKARREALTSLKLARIIEALDKASRFWMDTDHPRVAATIDRVATVTGMSREMVRRAVRHEMESSLAPDLEAALRNEVGDPSILDDFTYNPLLGGETFATGPDLVGGVVSANIPALPHLTVMRSLLVKSPCLIKSSTSEPFFLPEYARTLWEIDPTVGGAVAVVEFGREDEDLLRVFLEQVSFLIAYGGLQAVAELRARAPGDLPSLYHGHKLGFGMVSADGLTAPALAKRMAYDAILFDQEACLAPHVYFIESAPSQVVELAHEVVSQMEQIGLELPPGRRPIAWKLAVRQELDRLAMTGAEVVTTRDPRLGVVTVEEGGDFNPSPLGRFLRLCPVDSLDDVVNRLEPLRGLLQNAAIEASADRRRRLGRRLAQLGLNRLCPPGNMGTPTMMWHHDGRPCLAEMLTFTDYEVHGT